MEKELLEPFWGNTKRKGKKKKHKEKPKQKGEKDNLKLALELDTNRINQSDSVQAISKARSPRTQPSSFSPRKKKDKQKQTKKEEEVSSLVESPRIQKEDDEEIKKNCILWFLKYFPKVILQSASTQKYITTKSKNKMNTTQQIWKGKQSMELIATGQYKSAIDAYSKTSECFTPTFHQEHKKQISLNLEKDKYWIIDDQYEIIKLQKSTSQFDRKWFELQLYGDFFSLRCPISLHYIGVNEYNLQLECKQETVNSSELLKLIVKGSLRIKSTSTFISVRPDIVQANQSQENGSLEILIFEIGGINSKIYSCSGISQKSHRRYLSCWKDKNIEGSWHLGFPLHGHDQSELGSLVEEQFEISHALDQFYTIKACNGRYVTWNGSRLEANSTIINDSSLFEIISPTKKKKKRAKTFMSLHTSTNQLSNSSSSKRKSMINSQESPQISLRFPETTLTSSNEETYPFYHGEMDELSISPSSSGDHNLSLSRDYYEEPISRDQYRKSVYFHFLKKDAPSVYDFSDSICNMAEEKARSFLLYGESIVDQILKVSEVLGQMDMNNSYILGSLFVTNYRLLFIPNDYHENLFWQIPLCSLSQINFLDKMESEESENLCFAFEFMGKHWIQPNSNQKLIHSGYHFLITIPFNKNNHSHSHSLNPNAKLNLIGKLAFPNSNNHPNYSTKYFAYHFQFHYNGINGWNLFHLQTEYNRQIRNFNDSQRKWMIFHENEDFSICSSYPQSLIQPFGIRPDEIKILASRRSKMRLPSVTWIHPTNGAAFLRCSQPKQGWRSSKSSIESKYFSLICSADNPVIWIMDARPQINAMANRLKGAGYEDVEHFKEETYTVRLKFLGIGNIHVMRDSLSKLQKLCREQSSFDHYDKFITLVDSLCWFDHIRLLLKSSLRISSVIHAEGQTVVLHCSDGWDRTAQLSSLSQIIMDGFYRTICGFAVLIEKDWLSFGHKFADRTGQGDHNYKCKERSPIFIQFIDCIWQVLQQQPNYFEFNEWFLLSILEHFTSALFGTFLYNTTKERVNHKVKETTPSLWSYILYHKDRFENSSYDSNSSSSILPVDTNRVTLFRKYYLAPVL